MLAPPDTPAPLDTNDFLRHSEFTVQIHGNEIAWIRSISDTSGQLIVSAATGNVTVFGPSEEALDDRTHAMTENGQPNSSMVCRATTQAPGVFNRWRDDVLGSRCPQCAQRSRDRPVRTKPSAGGSIRLSAGRGLSVRQAACLWQP